MFGNTQQDDQTNNNTHMDQVAQDIGGGQAQAAQPVTASFGLGNNPSTFTPTQNPTPLPAPPAPSDNGTGALHHQEVIAPQHSTATSSTPPGDLDEIKTEALHQLSPLVGKLDQTAEEKYKTLMMLIQASDNHDLIKDAYAAANAIEDEKVRAEALLSIVNEINYFTQQSHN